MVDYKPTGDKPEVTREEYVHDHDLIMDKVDTQDALHMMELSPEEEVLALRLRRKIDRLIMPLVILVYLMNYIDR